MPHFNSLINSTTVPEKPEKATALRLAVAWTSSFLDPAARWVSFGLPVRNKPTQGWICLDDLWVDLIARAVTKFA